jgi:hypothetical protein
VKIGIACSADHSFGHASVARSLARAARAELPLERLVVLSDQGPELARYAFFDDWIEVLPLTTPELPALDVLLLDTIPFRRPGALFHLLQAAGRRRPRILVGHTGWVPAASARHLQEWRDRFAFLEDAVVVAYHGEDVCEGACHLTRITPRLRCTLVHAGLLLPEPPAPCQNPRAQTFAALSGGGFQAAALLEEALAVLERLPGWGCDFYVGSYADVHAFPAEVRAVIGAGDVAARLGSYAFSLTRSGYSSCCEHIAAQVPTMLAPLQNPEQLANATWAARFLRVATIGDDGSLVVREPARAAATPFSWARALGAVR